MNYAKTSYILIWGLIMMVTNVARAQDAPELTVWIRAGGPGVKNEISSFVQNVIEALPSTTTSKILICTNINDTILEELDIITKTNKSVEVIFSKLNSFSTALTDLAKHTDARSNVLTLSVGVNIREDQIQTGLKTLTGSVKVYGWQITEHGNDGSCPGKGWYNTAALIDKTIVQQMRKTVPVWVDNNYLPKEGNYTIGGNEEVPIMVYALQKEPTAKFILNTSDPVSSNLQLGTQITFEEKLARKVFVGNIYMKKLHKELNVETDFDSWLRKIWSSLEVI